MHLAVGTFDVPFRPVGSLTFILQFVPSLLGTQVLSPFGIEDEVDDVVARVFPFIRELFPQKFNIFRMHVSFCLHLQGIGGRECVR